MGKFGTRMQTWASIHMPNFAKKLLKGIRTLQANISQKFEIFMILNFLVHLDF